MSVSWQVLYSELTKTDISCVPEGIHHIQEIYRYVQKTYPSLCDDSIICKDVHKTTHNSPEWKHRVQTALGYRKLNEGSRISKPSDLKRGYWKFGPLSLSVVIRANTVPASPKGRDAYSIDAETIQGGWVYIIQNHSWPGWLKIGKAADLESRMRSYRTYEPHNGAAFEYLEAYESELALDIEQATHQFLSRKLSRDKNNATRRGEWYCISKQEAINAIKENWIGEFPASF